MDTFFSLFFFFFFFDPSLLLSWMFEYDCLDTCYFGCLICFVIVLLYLHLFSELSMFHMERRSRNMLIIVIIIRS